MRGIQNWFSGIVIFLVFFLIFSFLGIANLLTDYWWFESLGFSNIFLIGLKAKIFLFLAAGIIFFVFALINLGISTKLSKSKIGFKVKISVAAVFSLIIGMLTYKKWFLMLQYFNQVGFNLKDPIFLKDASFYMFSLPFMLAVWNFLMICIILTLLLVLIDYLYNIIGKSYKDLSQKQDTAVPVNNPNLKSLISGINKKVWIHLSVLGSLFFLLLSLNHYLQKFQIMYSEKGVVVGAGYADIVAYLPIIKTLMIIALVIAVLFYVWIFLIPKQQRFKYAHILMYGIIIYIILLFIGPTMISALVQNFKVSPNEINLEKQYINNNIKFTSIAYGIEDVEERDFAVEHKLDQEILSESQETIDNIRILDWRPLTSTYKQTQEIRLYYDLSSVDVDRYDINGKYTQVMISPRELNKNKIADNAKTWVNLHMVYTHGYGVVMSPVNKVTSEGLPTYLIKDIPPVSTADDEKLNIEKPEIYYGEKKDDFVLTNTKTNEFDYPKGNKNAYATYEGKGGVKLDSFFKKLIMALKFMDVKILLSSDITSGSRIMFSRNIQERISKLTPFFVLDKDPYPVISDGRIVWIQDAYTVSDKFPYSEKFNNINYIRNSVKIVVDAYDGDVTYYVLDEKDPIVMTYAGIFPKQFKSFEAMPDELKRHIRYPIDLFKIQSRIYSDYHMNDASVFYNKEDAWEIPKEIYGTGQQIQVEPYYIIMKLPENKEEEFVLMTPFTPIRKDNMISWLAARSDKENYGKLLVYKFPKEKLVYGPSQIEAKFDQDSEISQELTLWSQQGSKVIRGNLLVIPIGDSLLYVEPLYMQAEQGQLPQMKRVLISDGERVVMEKDLETGLEVLFEKKISKNETKSEQDLLTEAQGYYEDILKAMSENDWVLFGKNFDKLGKVLEELTK